MLMRLDTNSDELEVHDYFSFGTYNLRDWHGDLTFTQHTYWGPIASIVVYDSTEDSESIFIFSVFDDSLRKRITSSGLDMFIEFIDWN